MNGTYTYEYKKQYINLTTESGLAALNELGAMGWDLVHVGTASDGQSLCVFKKAVFKWDTAKWTNGTATWTNTITTPSIGTVTYGDPSLLKG
jgi:hypothetical protein